VIGGILGVWAAHLMFELPLWQVAVTVRTGPGQWFAETVATFGLLLTILGCTQRTPSAVPYAVGLYITAAYWFTASTSFANPAVTIARAIEYLRWHRTYWYHCLHLRSVRRHVSGSLPCTLVLAHTDSFVVR
jgi:glycerol uptake facilitator-like aquaporin